MNCWHVRCNRIRASSAPHDAANHPLSIPVRIWCGRPKYLGWAAPHRAHTPVLPILQERGARENAQLNIESMTLQVASFSIDDTLQQIDRDWRVFAASKALALKVQACTTMIASDRRLLSVILDNLVANAVKYTHLGEIGVDCMSQGDCLLVSVKDTGPGISRDVLGRFAQSACPALLNTNGSGLGLGLDIVHRSAALLGHEIDVASVPGIGTCVTVKVPLARSTETEPLAIGMSQQAESTFRV